MRTPLPVAHKLPPPVVMKTSGNGVTATGTNTGHPFDASVKVIFTVPNDIPDTIPVPEPTVATAVLLLVQEPVAASLSVVAVPTHVPGLPVIGLVLLTVIVVVVMHPVGNE